MPWAVDSVPSGLSKKPSSSITLIYYGLSLIAGEADLTKTISSSLKSYFLIILKRKILLTHTYPSPEGTISSALGEAQGARAHSLNVPCTSPNLCGYDLARNTLAKFKRVACYSNSLVSSRNLMYHVWNFYTWSFTVLRSICWHLLRARSGPDKIFDVRGPLTL
jgi:hypothetical protein